MVKFDADSQDWYVLKNEDELLSRYPPPLYGHYRPQPFNEPEQYPCLCRQVAIINNPNGADHVVMAYIYDFTEEK